MSNLQGGRASGGDIVFAGLTALFSVLGFCASLVFTVLKYRSDFTCDASYFSACQLGRDLDCGKVFASSWSTLFGLPVTAYAAAFYLVAFVVAAGLAGGRPLLGGRDDRRALFVLGVADVVVSVVMALYAKLVLETFCLYCMLLYLLSGILFLCGAWLCERGSGAALLAALRLGWLGKRHWMPAGLLAFLFFGVLLPHAVIYGNARRGAGRFADCPADLAGLPNTDLVAGARSPKWVLATFLDPACGLCLVQHEKLDALLREPEFAQRVALWIYLYPRAPHEPCVPPSFDAMNKSAVDNLACAGALAVECAERLAPGSGFPTLGRALALQRGDAPFFSTGNLKRLAEAQGIEGRRLLECVDDDLEVQRRVVAHTRFGAAQGIDATPRLYAIPVIRGALDLPRAFRFDGDKDRAVLESVVRSEPEANR